MKVRRSQINIHLFGCTKIFAARGGPGGRAAITVFGFAARLNGRNGNKKEGTWKENASSLHAARAARRIHSDKTASNIPGGALSACSDVVLHTYFIRAWSRNYVYVASK
jgi:hypothetical protein